MTTPKEPDAPLTLAEFLESVPPNTVKGLSQLYEITARQGTFPTQLFNFKLPDILIHCTNEICNGPRIHRPRENDKLTINVGASYHYLEYLCSNCRTNRKTFSVRMLANRDDTNGVFTKLGEHPPYGPITPTRLLKLLGDQREIFLRGRRCENQSLGIGAFSYYRRVVEHQKSKIIDEIIKASTILGAKAETIAILESAKAETQFSKSLSMVKDAIPQALLIGGHNPLTLLHAALSDGLHGRTDEECLEIAHDVRVLLAELSERLNQILKDEAELNSAVSRLLRPRSKE